MASKISTLALKDKVREFILDNPNEKSLNSLVEEAIVMADRDLRIVDSLSPLAWDITYYDDLRTTAYAQISAITKADPGVITAQSIDSGITGHGFHDHATVRDIVVIDNVEGMEQLNNRVFLLEYASATTFSLKTLDGLDAVNTTNYDTYSSSGVVYHAGFVLNATTVLANVDSKWTIKQLIPHATIDGFPLFPITENEVVRNKWQDASFSSRPERYRYWQNITTDVTTNHYIFLYPVCNQAYNLGFPYQKEIPDISVFNNSTYPFHPPQVHDAIWHGALSKLVGISKRVQRHNDKVIATQLEIAFRDRWQNEWEKDKIKTIELSRKMLGDMGNTSGFSA